MNAGAPEWVLWVGAMIGSMIAALVMRLGWKSGGGTKPAAEKSLQIEGALVDSSSVMKLAAAIEAMSMTLKEIEHRSNRSGEMRMEVLTKMMTAVSSLAASVERFVRDREEEEERREQREREALQRENERLARELKDAQRRGGEGR